MDLFPLLKTALILFSGITLMFLLTSFFIYKIKKGKVKEQDHENLSLASLKFSRENVVHSIAISEPEPEFVLPPKPTMEYSTMQRQATVHAMHQPRFQVVNAPQKGDILLQFNYNPKLVR